VDLGAEGAVARYECPRLGFRADVIEPLAAGDAFAIVTPVGTFCMTKADFYRDFPRVVRSARYRERGWYRYPRAPRKAGRYFRPAPPTGDVDAVVDRTFERVGPAGAAAGAVRLALGRPERDPGPGGDWRCRVVIAGLGRPIDRHAYGIDPLQALALALEMARMYLSFTPLADGERLTWLGASELGIPRVLGEPAT